MFFGFASTIGTGAYATVLTNGQCFEIALRYPVQNSIIYWSVELGNTIGNSKGFLDKSLRNTHEKLDISAFKTLQEVICLYVFSHRVGSTLSFGLLKGTQLVREDVSSVTGSERPRPRAILISATGGSVGNVNTWNTVLAIEWNVSFSSIVSVFRSGCWSR